MIAKETNLLKFIREPKQFIIPIYQRTYSWTIQECKELFKDIIKAGKNESISGHFIGSIVYISKDIYQIASVPKLLVIDGQQRLTTVTLLLTALCEIIESNGYVGEIKPDKLRSYYLVNDKEDDDLRHKLVLTKSDKETLYKVIDQKEILDDDAQRIKNNYKYFLDEIAKNEIEEVYLGIAKLMLIDVALDKERDNLQLIFESLNSTGLELT